MSECANPTQWFFLLLTALIFSGTCSDLPAGDLQTLEKAAYVENPANDGDSFTVKAGKRTIHARLYYVDCPEISASTDSDAVRVKEQISHFGVEDVKSFYLFGKQAAAFTKKHLKNKSFTVHTAFANALGRSKRGRVYVFVTTAEGHDLAELLVANGLARAKGMGRKTPDGIDRDEKKRRLQDLEIAAALGKKGIWKISNPERIAELRKQIRDEKKEREVYKARKDSAASVININTATIEQLQSLKGIGPVLARRIMEARPFEKGADLIKVNGIGKIKFRRIQSRITVQEDTSTKKATPSTEREH